MNKEYVLNKVKPLLNSQGMISDQDFDKLFSRLNKMQQYEIVNILIEASIEIDYDSVAMENVNDVIKYKGSSVNITKVDKLTNEQLCIIYQQGNQLALEALIRKNSRLVWSRVIKHGRKYKHKLDEEDLVQYGNMGLMEAARKFDLAKEAKFTTYCTWWIDQRILRGIMDYGFTIRIPVHYFSQINNLLRIMSQHPGCEKDELYQFAREEGIEREKFEELLMITENVMSLTSLNSIVGEDEDSELGDFKIDDSSPTVEEQVDYILLKETIASVLGTLRVREQDVIEERFGLKDGKDKTLEQIGIKYNVTRERIRQIEVKALRKLRHPSRSKKLKSYL
jgi:RNA polymerase primary sigma factor